MGPALIKWCDCIDASIARVCRFVIYVTTVLLFLILAANVFLRYVSGSSLRSAGEAPELMFPWMVMAGVVLAAQYGSHIAISWLMDKLATPVRRIFAIMNCLILVVAYGTLAWGTITLMPIVHTEHTHVLGVPSSVTYACMLIAFVMLVTTSITQTIRMLINHTASGVVSGSATGQAPAASH
jgi:TRAP-type C4-dicarboxylate transport system permease small subunit